MGPHGIPLNYLTATDPLTEEEFGQLVKGDTLKSCGIGVNFTVIAVYDLLAWGFDGSFMVTYLYNNVTPTGDTLARLRPWLVEGTREWAMWQVSLGKEVTHTMLAPGVSTKKLAIYKEPRWATGWSLYEPTPEPTLEPAKAVSALDKYIAWMDANKMFAQSDLIVASAKEIRDRLAALEER